MHTHVHTCMFIYAYAYMHTLKTHMHIPYAVGSPMEGAIYLAIELCGALAISFFLSAGSDPVQGPSQRELK